MTMLNFLKSAYISVFFLSMVPLSEAKGAMLLAMSLNLNLPLTGLLSFIGSGIIIVILVNIICPLIEWLKTTHLFKKMALKMEANAKKYQLKINKKTEGRTQFLKYILVFLFVVIPFPGTGVYTGTLLCGIMNLNKFWSCITILLANLVGVVIVTLGAMGILAIF